jgi:hypothetical protein
VRLSRSANKSGSVKDLRGAGKIQRQHCCENKVVPGKEATIAHPVAFREYLLRSRFSPLASRSTKKSTLSDWHFSLMKAHVTTMLACDQDLKVLTIGIPREEKVEGKLSGRGSMLRTLLSNTYHELIESVTSLYLDNPASFTSIT